MNEFNTIVGNVDCFRRFKHAIHLVLLFYSTKRILRLVNFAERMSTIDSLWNRMSTIVSPYRDNVYYCLTLKQNVYDCFTLQRECLQLTHDETECLRLFHFTEIMFTIVFCFTLQREYLRLIHSAERMSTIVLVCRKNMIFLLYRENVWVFTWVKPECRSAMHAGSCTVWSMASSPTVRCPPTRPSAGETTPSTPSSARQVPESTCLALSSLTLSRLSSVSAQWTTLKNIHEGSYVESH